MGSGISIFNKRIEAALHNDFIDYSKICQFIDENNCGLSYLEEKEIRIIEDIN